VKKLTVYSDTTKAWGLIEADALTVLAKLPDSSVDAIVTDPPYGIDIMGQAWDGAAIRRAVSDSGEKLTTGEALERWTQAWASDARRVLKPGGHLIVFSAPRTCHKVVQGVENAGFEIRDQLLWLHAQGVPKGRKLPGGLGTALKPVYEPILLARKPFDGKAIDNLELHGTGALNIDAARVGGPGYWPAHLALSHAPGCGTSCTADCPTRVIDAARPDLLPSRLFFCAKATRKEREAGCDELPRRAVALYTGKRRSPRLVRNTHPTVKPLELMRWLVRLVTPPGGVVLDPFTGSGSTGVATVVEKRQFLGIEQAGGYVDISCARLTHWAKAAKESS
jgi:DNA modification methylase